MTDLHEAFEAYNKGINMKEKIWYIAGAMTGYPDFNRDMFYRAESYLYYSQQSGTLIFNPARYDEKIRGMSLISATGNPADIGMTADDLHEIIEIDLEAVKACTHILMLPHWERSTGATAEHSVAKWMGKEIFFFKDEKSVDHWPDDRVMDRLLRHYICLLPSASIQPTEPATALSNIYPHDAKERKQMPICTGALDYFPLAIAGVAEASLVGNKQHFNDAPLHWDRSKSSDEPDALLRHLAERRVMLPDGTYVMAIDTDGVAIVKKVAWRALALCERYLHGEII